MKVMLVNGSPHEHGCTRAALDEVAKELAAQGVEGLQTMRTLTKYMAWMLKCIEAGKVSGITLPQLDPIVRTNFIR